MMEGGGGGRAASAPGCMRVGGGRGGEGEDEEDEEGRLERGGTAGNHTEKWGFHYDPTGAGRYGSPLGPTRAQRFGYLII